MDGTFNLSQVQILHFGVDTTSKITTYLIVCRQNGSWKHAISQWQKYAIQQNDPKMDGIWHLMYASVTAW